MLVHIASNDLRSGAGTVSGWKSALKNALRPTVNALRRAKRTHEIKRSAPAIRKQRIVDDLKALGLKSGDVIFLHSSLKSMGYVEGGPQTVLSALYDAISPDGTLIVPTYHMPGGSIGAACREDGYVFDPRRHGTDLGTLPAAFLKFPGVERSIHPTHSVSASGKHAKYVTESHHTSPSIFGYGSPWQRCLELNGKVLGLGVTMGPVTFYHLLEDTVLGEFPLPVRMDATHRLRCRDWGGNLIEVPVTPLDPRYAQQRIDTPGRGDLRDYFWREFERAGLLKTGKVGEGKAWYIEARGFYEHLHRLMKEGITIYSTPAELQRRPLP